MTRMDFFGRDLTCIHEVVFPGQSGPAFVAGREYPCVAESETHVGMTMEGGLQANFPKSWLHIYFVREYRVSWSGEWPIEGGGGASNPGMDAHDMYRANMLAFLLGQEPKA